MLSSLKNLKYQVIKEKLFQIWGLIQKYLSEEIGMNLNYKCLKGRNDQFQTRKKITTASCNYNYYQKFQLFQKWPCVKIDSRTNKEQRVKRLLSIKKVQNDLYCFLLRANCYPKINSSVCHFPRKKTKFQFYPFYVPCT